MSALPCSQPLSDQQLLLFLNESPQAESFRTHLDDEQCPWCLSRLETLLAAQQESDWLPPPPTDLIPALAPSSRSDSLGRIGQYEILRIIGQGGMGIVYEAEQPVLNRRVALKVPRPTAGPEFIARFLREGRAQAAVRDPRIVSVIEVVPPSAEFPCPYLVMELIPGEPLDRRLKRDRTVAPLEACRLTREVALGLMAAHKENLIHRDVKPSNVLVCLDGSVKLTDFGLARTLTGEGTQTRTGLIVGTPNYMAPEQAQGHKDIGPAADIYSTGAMLYELLTGRPPFLADHPLETVRQALQDDPVSPRRLNPQIPLDVETLCLKCLEKTPSRRYQSAEELADRLGLVLEGKPLPERPLSWWGHLLRWARREPAKAALVATVAFLVLAVATVSTVFAVLYRNMAENEKGLRQRAEQSEQNEKDLRQRAQQSEQKEALARQQAESALAEERVQTYFQRITIAAQELSKGNVGMAESLLAQCPEHLRKLEWRLLYRRCRPELFVLPPHPDGALCVAFSPDGKHIASGGVDGVLRVCAADPVKETWAKTDNGGSVWTVAFHPLCKELASGGKDGVARVRNAQTGEVRLSLTHGGELRSLSYSPDGLELATAGLNGQVRLWDARTGQLRRTISLPDSEAVHVRYRDDGKQLAVGALKGKPGKRSATVSLWSQGGEKKEHEFALNKAVVGLAYAAASQVLVAADSGGGLSFWESATGTPRKPSQEKRLPSALAISGNGRFALADMMHSVRLLDLAGSEREFVTLGGHADHIHTLAFSPDGHRLASAGLDGKVRVWDASSGRSVQPSSFIKALQLEGPIGIESPVIIGPCFTPHGSQQLITPCYTAAVPVWSPESGKEKQSLPGVPLGMYAGFASNGDRLVVLGGEGDVSLYEGQSFKPAEYYRVSKEEDKKHFIAGAVSFGSAHAALAGTDQVVRLVHLKDGKVVDLPGHTGTVRALAFSPDGKFLASGSHDQTIRIWQVDSGKHLHTLTGHEDVLTGLAFSADGALLASASTDLTVRLWRVESWKLARVLKGHESEVRGVTFASDGRLLSCGADRDLKIWDPQRGQLLMTLEKALDTMYSVRVSPDGRFIAGGTKGYVLVWDLGPTEAVVDKIPTNPEGLP